MSVRRDVFDRSSLSHLLVRCQLFLQLSVFVVPHQIVDRITTLLRSFLSRNHPRIIVCPPALSSLWIARILCY